MIVLDASVLIAVGDPSDSHHQNASRFYVGERRPMRLHPMTLAEVLVGPTKVGSAAQYLDDLRRGGLRTTAVEDGEPLRLARLRVDTGLRLPDCCVLSAALQENADLATFDRRLATAAERLGVRVIS